MTKFTKTRTLALATATSALAWTAPAYAQDAAAQDDDAIGNNVIVVTAQKKSQNLQDVPISIAAFDETALENERLEGVEDIGKLVPGVYVTPNPADPTGVRVNIRGIGTFDPQVGQDSRIAIYSDGVYLGKTQGLAFDAPDLARVEILKGPQGTLYGRNSVAGAVNLISAQPEPGEWSGKVTAEYGRFNHFKLAGVVNMPIGEDGALRVSAQVKDQDGWVKNDGPGVDFGGATSFGLRAAMGVDLTPEFNVVAAFDYNNTKTEPLFYQTIPGFANPGSFFAPAIMPVAGRQRRTTTFVNNEKGDLETYGGSITANWEVAPDHNLKFIAAYRETESSRFVNLLPQTNPLILNGILNSDIVPPVPGVQSINSLVAGTALLYQLAGQPLRPDFATQFTGNPPEQGLFISPPGGSPSLADHRQYSFELTYNGEVADGALEYTIGAFYFNEKTGTPVGFPGNRNDANSYLFILAGLNPALGSPIINGTLTAGALAPTLNNPMVPQATKDFLIATQLMPHINTLNIIYGSARQSAANELRIATKAFALYGEATWHATDRLRITPGLRFSNEKKDGVGQAKSPFFLDNTDLLGNVIPTNVSGFSFSKVNPSLVIEFDIHDDVMYYASFKQSFRSGGFNQGAIAPRLAGQTFGPDFNFGREDINAYEFGMKSDFWDNRIRLNAAGFFYDFKNQQTTTATDPLVATARAVVNTDEKIWGAEVDLLFALTDDLSLSGTYSFIDGNAGDVPLLIPPFGTLVRSELQGTPKHSFRIGANYTTWVTDNVELFGNISYSYKDDVLAVPQNALRLSNQNIVSGRIGANFETSNGTTWSLALWGQNIFDDKYQIDSLPFETFAFRTEVFGQPATYGITAGVKF